MNNNTNNLKILIPIMLSFFTMGIVDLVGVATNYARNDFSLDDLTASILPMMVFLWFAVFSIPAGILMSRIGRKKTVLLSILLGIIALVVPFLFYNFYVLIAALALLGIGNTILQVSLNPLAASIVDSKKLASTLTLGQFVKAIASFLGPILASMTAKQFGDWKLVLVVYAATSLLSFICLYFTPIEEEKREKEPVTFVKTVVLLKDIVIFQLFLGILLIVGIDVCMNTNIPQLLTLKLNLATETATLGSSLYFGARTAGAFLGAMILTRVKPAGFLNVNMIVAGIAFLMLMFIGNDWAIYTAIVLVGFTCANVFSILFSFALQYKYERANEISSLMVMGIAGGAIVTPLVGLIAKNVGIPLSFGLLFLCVIYLFFLSFRFSKQQ